MQDKIKKIVLAYSGGLDTSVILKWLVETYKCEVITFSADLGQEEELTISKRRPERPVQRRYTSMILKRHL